MYLRTHVYMFKQREVGGGGCLVILSRAVEVSVVVWWMTLQLSLSLACIPAVHMTFYLEKKIAFLYETSDGFYTPAPYLLAEVSEAIHTNKHTRPPRERGLPFPHARLLLLLPLLSLSLDPPSILSPLPFCLLEGAAPCLSSLVLRCSLGSRWNSPTRAETRICMYMSAWGKRECMHICTQSGSSCFSVSTTGSQVVLVPYIFRMDISRSLSSVRLLGIEGAR